MAERVVGGLELGERGHERLGHVPAAEVALHPPAARSVGIEQAGVDRRRAERDVRPIVTGRLGALDEERDAERVLGRPLPGVARRLDAAGDVDADGRDLAQGLGDIGRGQAAGQDDRHLPGDAAAADRDALAGAARMGPAGRVEEDALDAGGE